MDQDTLPDTPKLLDAGDPQQHPYGVGLQNIRSVVDRYEGVMEVESETEFSLNIMLPVASR